MTYPHITLNIFNSWHTHIVYTGKNEANSNADYNKITYIISNTYFNFVASIYLTLTDFAKAIPVSIC